MLSQSRSTFQLAIIFFASVVLLGATPQDTESKFRFGHDFELSTQHLANLVPHFDLYRLESRLRIRPEVWNDVMSKEILDEYITFPGTLEALPDELRARLTKDLNLSLSLVDHQSNTIVQPSIVLGSSAMPIKPEPKGLKIPVQGLAPAPIKNLPTQRSLETNGAGLLVPKGSDWQELARRWRALKVEEKRAVARFHRLPSRVIAEIIETKIPARQKIVSDLEVYLRPSEDAPEWMNRVTYSLDGRSREVVPGARQSVEIALREPMKNKEKFYSHLDEVAKTTGLKTELESPQLMKRSSAATHIHFSIDGVGEASMERVMHAWRRLVMVRLLDAGDQYDSVLEIPIGERGEMLQNIYDRELTAKHNLVRKVTANHYELKEHAKNVKEELNEVLGLFDVNENAALEKMEKEVVETTRRNPSILARIKRFNPNILRDFQGIVPKQEIEESIEGLFRRSLASEKWPVVFEHLSRYSKVRYATEELWSSFEKILRDPPGPYARHGINTIVRGWNLEADHPISQKYLEFYLANPQHINRGVIETIRHQGTMTPEVERSVASVLASAVENSETVGAGKRAAGVLRDMAFAYRPNWELDDLTRSSIRSAIERVLKVRPQLADVDLVTLHAAALAVNIDHKVPAADRAVLRRAILSPSNEVVSSAMYVVERALPEEMMFAKLTDATFQNFYRPEAVETAVKIAGESPSTIVRRVTQFRSHGASSLLSFADLHSLPGFTDEVVRLIKLQDPKQLARSIGPDGFAPLLRPRTLEAFDRLADAVETSGSAELKDLFRKVAPPSVERALKLSEEWNPAAERRIQSFVNIPTPNAETAGSRLGPVEPTKTQLKGSILDKCHSLWDKLKSIK